MQYMANFFTDQARQNNNHFETLDDELKYLIYQYTPEFLDLDESHFQQIYFFFEWSASVFRFLLERKKQLRHILSFSVRFFLFRFNTSSAQWSDCCLDTNGFSYSTSMAMWQDDSNHSSSSDIIFRKVACRSTRVSASKQEASRRQLRRRGGKYAISKRWLWHCLRWD